MNQKRIEEIKELTRTVFNIKSEDLFIAQMLFEKLDHQSQIDNITEEDINEAKWIYEECYLCNRYENTKWNTSITEALNGDYIFDNEED